MFPIVSRSGKCLWSFLEARPAQTAAFLRAVVGKQNELVLLNENMDVDQGSILRVRGLIQSPDYYFSNCSDHPSIIF